VARNETHEPTTRANSTQHRHTQICEWSIHSSGKHAFQHPKPSHTGRRAASRRMLRGIWPRVRVRHCDSCIVRISSVHFRTFALWPGTWLVCAHLTWSTHCRWGKGNWEILLYRYYCARGVPLFDAAEIRAGCVPVLRLYYNLSQ